MNIKYVTLTGVDEYTRIDDINHLFDTYPILELAVLYSPTKKNDTRYPGFEFIMNLLSWQYTQRDCALAVHLCGQAVKQAFQREDKVASILSTCDDNARRVQLNFRQDASADHANTVKAIEDLVLAYPNIQFILQDNAYNTSVISGLIASRTPISVLCDNSGGQGIKQALWPIPKSGVVRYGYAGGLGPDNIMSELKKIASVVPNGIQTWIDMESSLRVSRDTLDIFSVTKCEDVLNQVYAFLGTYT